MKKYRKLPVEIKAIKWEGDNFTDVDNFITVPHEIYLSQGFVFIETLEGKMF